MKKTCILSFLFLFLTSISFAGTINLPKTGQTKCWDTNGTEISCAGTGQDGELQAGVAWPDPRFTDNGDGTMIDNLTGLMWARNANLPNGYMTWYQAIDYCNNLTLGGYSDWRLPNINELESLVNASQGYLPTWLTAQGFTNVQDYLYWSSTTSALNTYGAWVVAMWDDGGVAVAQDKSASICHVWSVRGGQCGQFVNSVICLPQTGQKVSYAAGDDGDLEKGIAWPVPRFIDHGNGTVTDNLTGLIWTKNASLPNGYITWQQALDYVASLNASNYFGYTDWRLPNRKELFSLIDHSQYNPFLPADHPFTNVQSSLYWSSTTYAYSPDQPWTVSVWYGTVNGRYSGTKSDSNSLAVWPVRGGQTVEPDNYDHFRIWIDRNSNGTYDAGEGVSGASVWVNNAYKGNTNSDGTIVLQGLKDTDKIYAYKNIGQKQNPRATHDFGGKSNNPYYAQNETDAVNGNMYNLVMASDKLGLKTGDYSDFPYDGSLKGEARDGQGNILIPLEHSKIEWNLVVVFQEQPSSKEIENIKTGFRNAANFVYNYTDGYSVLRNIVLVKGAYESSEQGKWCDIRIFNEIERWHSAVGGSLTNPPYSSGIEMPTENAALSADKKSHGGPTDQEWAAALGHELGHYLFGFLDEYANGDYNKEYHYEDCWLSFILGWDYRCENDGGWGEQNYFPLNYGLMDANYMMHELSDSSDYRPPDDTNNPDQMTNHYMQRDRESTWQWFKDQFEPVFREALGVSGTANLIVPPHTEGSYNGTTQPKREGPSSMNHNNVNFIEWTLPGSFGESGIDIFDARLQVKDTNGNPVHGAQVWLSSPDRKTHIGETDKKGILEASGIQVGKELHIYHAGSKTIFPLTTKQETISVVLSGKRLQKKSSKANGILPALQTDNVPGVIVSAKPHDTETLLDITLWGDNLSALPIVHLSQPNGLNLAVSMASIGGNMYAGTSSYDYYSGNIEVNAVSVSGSNQSLNPFIIPYAVTGTTNSIYSYSGGLELTYYPQSFSQSGKVAIVESTAVAPPNSDRVQVGSIWSVMFSDTMKPITEASLNIALQRDELLGMDITQLNLYGWDKDSGIWRLVEGGLGTQEAFRISLEAMDYESYALFAPRSSDTIPPNPVTDFRGSTGNNTWCVNLQWTAPSDIVPPGVIANVYSYDIHYNTTPITENNFENCPSVEVVPQPESPGTMQSISVQMPDPDTTYYFALRSTDAAGNTSPLSIINTPIRSQVTDTDGDGMPDAWEEDNYLNAAVNDAQNDNDNDGLKNIDEYHYRTDPNNTDTDKDGYSDYEEVQAGSDPLDPNSIPVSSCSTWSDVINKYNNYVTDQATWTDVISCYNQYVSP
jgi:hypothetical protein